MQGVPRYKKFNNCAGFVVHGDRLVEVPTKDAHGERVFWLTAMLESPRWGTVQSYDGAGISAGPLHAVAVYKRLDKQGMLFELVRDIQPLHEACGVEGFEELLDLLEENNVYNDAFGTLRSRGTHAPLTGMEVVELLTGPNGYVREVGFFYERAKAFAQAFSQIFSDAKTFPTQKLFAHRWIFRPRDSHEWVAYERFAGAPRGAAPYLRQSELGAELDLAMCLYHMYSVNAPSKAREYISFVAEEASTSMEFSKKLVKALTTSEYGSWSGRRRDRALAHVHESRLWDSNVITAVCG